MPITSRSRRFLPALVLLSLAAVSLRAQTAPLAGVFQLLGALVGPETRDVDMTSAIAPGSRNVQSGKAPA